MGIRHVRELLPTPRGVHFLPHFCFAKTTSADILHTGGGTVSLLKSRIFIGQKGVDMGSSQPSLTNAMRGALKAAVLSVWDVVDRAGLRLTWQHDLPPVSLRKHVAPLHQFVPTVEEYIAYFKLLGDLRMSDTVLDIGRGDLPCFFGPVSA